MLAVEVEVVQHPLLVLVVMAVVVQVVLVQMVQTLQLTQVVVEAVVDKADLLEEMAVQA
jgi:hypothetical protein